MILMCQAVGLIYPPDLAGLALRISEIRILIPQDDLRENGKEAQTTSTRDQYHFNMFRALL